MQLLHLIATANAAVAGSSARPATSVVHDSADARIILFRIDPGQEVPVHTNPSTVLLVVISRAGVVVTPDGDREVHAGDLVAYEPREPHGMRAADERLVIAAVIAPRPGQAPAPRVREMTR